MKKFIGWAAIALVLTVLDVGSANAQQGRGSRNSSSGRSFGNGRSSNGRSGRVYYRPSNNSNGAAASRSNDRFGYGYPFGYPPTGYGFNQLNFSNPGYGFANSGYNGPPYGGNSANRRTYSRR